MAGKLGSLIKGRGIGQDLNFAAVAERHRRQGQPSRAVEVCREGLERFPDQLSARVTLGWALLELEQYDEARAELEAVIRRAPDNLAAIRGLAELHDKQETAGLLAMEQSGEWPPPLEDIERAVAEHPREQETAATPADEPAVVAATSDLLEEADALEALAELNEVEVGPATLDLAPEGEVDLEALASALAAPEAWSGGGGGERVDREGEPALEVEPEILLDADLATGNLDELVALEGRTEDPAIVDPAGDAGGDDDPTPGGQRRPRDAAPSSTPTESALDALERLLDQAKARQHKIAKDSAA